MRKSFILLLGILLLVQGCGKTDNTNGEYVEVVPLEEYVETEKIYKVEYGYQDLYISVMLPEDWDYEIAKYADENTPLGISFWPAEYSEGEIRFQYFPYGFGVCGTGLKSEETSISGIEASIGTYDNHEVWDFISFSPPAENYTIINKGADAWWDEYGEEAMAILKTIQIGIPIDKC